MPDTLCSSWSALTKAAQKRREKQSVKKVTKCITRVVLLVILNMICPFFHENHGVFIHEQSYREESDMS